MDLLTGIMNGADFTIPVGTVVNPVYRQENGHIWADAGIRTIRESHHTQFRRVPTDGSFLTFETRNLVGARFAIALFNKPIQTSRGLAIGCVVDFDKVHHDDLPF